VATATILSVATKPASDPTGGAWPDSGSLGYWYKTQASLAAVGADASLPAAVTSCAWALPANIGIRDETASGLATMLRPAALGGGRLVYTWGDLLSGGARINLTTTSPALISLHCYSQAVAPPQLSILDAATSAVLDSVSLPTTAYPPSTWYRAVVDGAVAIRFDSQAWRVSGLIFTPTAAPARLLCLESGVPGLYFG